jgi:soluble lytic murein transglycosylase
MTLRLVHRRLLRTLCVSGFVSALGLSIASVHASAATPQGAATQPAPAATAPAKPVPKAAPTGPTLLPQAAPQPGAASAERASNARYDAAIAPIRDAKVAADEIQRLTESIGRAAANDLTGAVAARTLITDPTTAKLADWFRLRAGVGSAEETRAFVAANPSWPDRELLMQRVGQQLFRGGGDSRAIKQAFSAKDPPKHGAGLAALASAELAEGNDAAARALAQRTWRDYDLPVALEAGFIERFGGMLTEADHRARLDRLLSEDPRWAGERAERITLIKRTIALLPATLKPTAEARLAVLARTPNALALLDAAAAQAKAASTAPDWGLVMQKVQQLRRLKRRDEAWALLLTVPADSGLSGNDGWWVERRINAYEALEANKPKLAYDVVRAPGPLGANPKKDQAFLAGWLALRFLNDPKAALAHFRELKTAADGTLSKSRADYWLGRALDAAGDKAEARNAYRSASQFTDTFHGQLARRKVGSAEAMSIEVKPPAAPTSEQVARFQASDAARAAVIAKAAKLDVSIVRAFLLALGRTAASEAEAAMAAHLANAMGDTLSSVRIGKDAIQRGLNLVTYAYPVHPFPAYGALRQPPETAFLLAIARQESEFNTQTLSGAGARGILQVMPVTARHVCLDYKLKCDIPRLMTDPAYNAMMASAYIADRMGEFGGSYVMGIAGYNAGPGRVRQWVREFGDPRDPKVDPIDWIHRIPFEETREYVQRVLSNLQIYRARLSAGPAPLMIADDLARAREGRGGAAEAAQ